MDDAARQLPDFDRLRILAARDPAAFEAERRQVIEATIARAPADRQQRLRCLQWRIEQVRRRAPSPLAACVALSGMMWDAVAGKGGLLETLAQPNAPTRTRDCARVIPLRAPDG